MAIFRKVSTFWREITTRKNELPSLVQYKIANITICVNKSPKVKIWLDRSFDFYKVTWSVSRMEITFFYCSCATKENERERLNYQKTISFVFADMDTSKRQFTINKTLLDCVLYAILLLIVENNEGGGC